MTAGLRGVASSLGAATAAGAAFAALMAGGLALRQAVTDANAFGKAMAEVQTIISDDVPIGELREGVEALAEAQGLNESLVAKGLYQTISAGVGDAADALLVLEEANELAVGGLATTPEAVNLITSALNAYGKEVGEAERVSDIFFETVRSGKTTIPELASSIATALPIAAQLQVGLEELNAAGAALTLGGTPTSEAFTQIRASMLALLRRAPEIRDLFASIGEEFDVANVGAVGLVETLRKLSEAVEGDEVALTELLGRAEAVNAVLALTGNQAADFDRILADLEGSAGAAGRAFRINLEEPSNRIARFFNAGRVALQRFGADVVRRFANIIDAVRGADELERFFDRLGGLLGVGVVFSLETLEQGIIGAIRLLDLLAAAANRVADAIATPFEILFEVLAEFQGVNVRAVTDELEEGAGAVERAAALLKAAFPSAPAGVPQLGVKEAAKEERAETAQEIEALLAVFEDARERVGAGPAIFEDQAEKERAALRAAVDASRAAFATLDQRTLFEEDPVIQGLIDSLGGPTVLKRVENAGRGIFRALFAVDLGSDVDAKVAEIGERIEARGEGLLAEAVQQQGEALREAIGSYAGIVDQVSTAIEEGDLDAAITAARQVRELREALPEELADAIPESLIPANAVDLLNAFVDQAGQGIGLVVELGDRTRVLRGFGEDFSRSGREITAGWEPIVPIVRDINAELLRQARLQEELERGLAAEAELGRPGVDDARRVALELLVLSDERKEELQGEIELLGRLQQIERARGEEARKARAEEIQGLQLLGGNRRALERASAIIRQVEREETKTLASERDAELKRLAEIEQKARDLLATRRLLLAQGKDDEAAAIFGPRDARRIFEAIREARAEVLAAFDDAGLQALAGVEAEVLALEQQSLPALQARSQEIEREVEGVRELVRAEAERAAIVGESLPLLEDRIDAAGRELLLLEAAREALRSPIDLFEDARFDEALARARESLTEDATIDEMVDAFQAAFAEVSSSRETFFDGFSAGFAELERRFLDFGAIGVDTALRLGRGFQSAISSSLQKVGSEVRTVGDFIEDLGRGVLDTVRAAAAEAASQVIVGAALKGLRSLTSSPEGQGAGGSGGDEGGGGGDGGFFARFEEALAGPRAPDFDTFELASDTSLEAALLWRDLATSFGSGGVPGAEPRFGSGGVALGTPPPTSPDFVGPPEAGGAPEAGAPVLDQAGPLLFAAGNELRLAAAELAGGFGGFGAPPTGGGAFVGPLPAPAGAGGTFVGPPEAPGAGGEETGEAVQEGASDLSAASAVMTQAGATLIRSGGSLEAAAGTFLASLGQAAGDALAGLLGNLAGGAAGGTALAKGGVTPGLREVRLAKGGVTPPLPGAQEGGVFRRETLFRVAETAAVRRRGELVAPLDRDGKVPLGVRNGALGVTLPGGRFVPAQVEGGDQAFAEGRRAPTRAGGSTSVSGGGVSVAVTAPISLQVNEARGGDGSVRREVLGMMPEIERELAGRIASAANAGMQQAIKKAANR